MSDTKHYAGTRAEFGDSIPDKATLYDAWKREISLHERTKRLHAEAVFQLGAVELELCQVRGELERLRAAMADAMSMAIEPEERVTDWVG